MVHDAPGLGFFSAHEVVAVQRVLDLLQRPAGDGLAEGELQVLIELGAVVADLVPGGHRVDDAELGEYDFQRKGFPVGEFDGNRTRYFNDAYDYKLAWSNRDQLRFAPVADEAAARLASAARCSTSCT